MCNFVKQEMTVQCTIHDKEMGNTCHSDTIFRKPKSDIKNE